ncbi:chondroadherin-like [Asterias rubens]|uniref:chondroadherin-like n=1 Tax=Asterias rubens TaxID=7604 RepID=UPI00145586B5|nr:chondroadherin-like [Asterias rubens]
METQYRQVFWLWLMLAFFVASMQTIVNGEACDILILNRTADCSGRNLRTLPDPRSIQNTSAINFSRNALQRFPGENVEFTSPHLETLDLSQSQIEELDLMAFGFVPSLRYLNISHNKLSSIMNGSFINLKNLQDLDISFNNLLDLSEGLWEGLNEVKKLYLSSNSLTTLKAGAFDFLKQLVYLDLSENQISIIKEDAFTDLANLQHLNLYRNTLTEVPLFPDNFRRKLEKLNLQGNSISKLGPIAFGRCLYLHVLDLSKLDLDYVHALAFQGLPALTELYLDTNLLQTLQVQSIDGLHNLKSLTLFSNPWVCDCNFSKLAEYLVSNTSRNITVTRIESTSCRGSDTQMVPLHSLESRKLCTGTSHVVPAVVGSTVLVIAIIVMFCVCRKKKMHEPRSPGVAQQASPSFSEQSSPVTMTYFEDNLPGSSGANSSPSGDKSDVFTTSDHFYSSIKVVAPVYCYADSRDLLPQGPVGYPTKSSPKKCFTCPSKPGGDKEEAKDEELYLKPVKTPPIHL